MNKIVFVATLICLLSIQSKVLSQTEEPPRYEVAAEFTTLTRNGGSDAGAGVRFTFNFNKSFAIEGATHIFHQCSSCANNSRVYDVFGGIKAGKRFEKWGIFAKARPGVVKSSEGQFDIIPTGTGGPFPFQGVSIGRDHFAADIGGVVEFYPSRRIVTRFDVGDTIIHFKSHPTHGLGFDPSTGTYFLIPFTNPARTTHNFQFMASVGFRF